MRLRSHGKADTPKGPILTKPPEPSKKRKLHFLERTDPHFKKDLAESVGHVAYVVQQLTRVVRDQTHATVTDVQFTQLETICRETVKRRRAFSDKGDVQVTWKQSGIPMSAILEVKQRKSPKFSKLSEFPYKTVITDEKRLFDKIRARGDTIGYLLTNHDRQVFLFVSHDRAEESFTTHTSMDRFKGRIRTYVDVPVAEFTEGEQECGAAILETLAAFTPRSNTGQTNILDKIRREKLHKLRAELSDCETRRTKLTRDIARIEGELS